MDRILFLCLCGVFLLLPLIHSYAASDDNLKDVDAEIEQLAKALDERQTGGDSGGDDCEDACDGLDSEDFEECIVACMLDTRSIDQPDKRFLGIVRRIIDSARRRQQVRRIVDGGRRIVDGGRRLIRRIFGKKK